MFWIFALGIISLMVWHPGFRKVMFWILGIGTGLTTITVACYLVSDRMHTAQLASEEQAKREIEFSAWIKKHPTGCKDPQYVKMDAVDVFLASDGNCWAQKSGEPTEFHLDGSRSNPP